MNNSDIIKQKFKLAIAVSEEKQKKSENIIKIKEIINMKAGLVACVCLILITGVTFAKEIKEFIFNIYRLGPKTSIDNGYIAEYNGEASEYKAIVQKENKIQEIKTNISLKNFTVSNESISVDLLIEFSNEINNFIKINKTDDGNLNYEKFYIVEFTDLYVIDEEKNLIYSPYLLEETDNEEEKFNEICKEYNLNLEYGKFNEKYFLNTLNEDIWEYNEEKNELYMSLNIGKSTLDIPKSKNLKIIINEIKMLPKDIKEREDASNYITIRGEWKFDIEVPQIMYNREEISYKVSSVENKDIEVLKAIVTETNLELDILISNIEEPIMPEECSRINDEVMQKNGGEMSYPSTREGYLELYGSEKLLEEYERFLRKQRPINYSGEQIIPWKKSNSGGCFILDENGKKFNVIPAGCIGNFCYNSKYDENGFTVNTFLNQYESHLNFEMTKYEATDKIEVIIDYMGIPSKIVLHKI